MALKPELIPRVARRFAALADESRLALLVILADGELNVSALVERTGIAQASVSKHLAVLAGVGLVAARREGNAVFYRVADDSVFEMCQIVCDGVVRHAMAEHAAMGLPATSGAVSTASRRPRATSSSEKRSHS